MPNSLKARLKKLKYQGVLSQEDVDRIVILPITETVNKDITYIEEWLKDKYALNSRDREVLTTAIQSMKSAIALSNAIQDTVEELSHIETEPYDTDDYQEGVTDGIQLAIRTINERTNIRR